MFKKLAARRRHNQAVVSEIFRHLQVMLGLVQDALLFALNTDSLPCLPVDYPYHDTHLGFVVVAAPSSDGRVLNLYINCPNRFVRSAVVKTLRKQYSLASSSLTIHDQHVWCTIDSGHGQLALEVEARHCAMKRALLDSYSS